MEETRWGFGLKTEQEPVVEKRGGAPGGARSIERPALDFSSGRDLTAREFKPHVRLCADSVEPIWDPLSLSPSLFLSQNE